MGPTLFILYINNMPDMLEGMVKLFADDTKVWRAIQETVDCEALQKDLNRLKDWFRTWQLAFNGEKCKLICKWDVQALGSNMR